MTGDFFKNLFYLSAFCDFSTLNTYCLCTFKHVSLSSAANLWWHRIRSNNLMHVIPRAQQAFCKGQKSANLEVTPPFLRVIEGQRVCQDVSQAYSHLLERC